MTLRSLLNPLRKRTPRRSAQSSRARLRLTPLESRVTPSAIPPPPGLVGWWPGDGDAIDLVGSNNGALQNGATSNHQAFVADGFDFSQPDAVFQASTTGLPTGAADRTLELWVRLDSPDQGGVAILAQYGTHGATSEAVYLYLSGGRYPGLSTFNSGIEASQPLDFGRWHHVAATFATGVASLYVDGQLTASGTLLLNTTPGTQLHLGNLPGTGWYLNGKLDEPSIHDRALSTTEIQTIHEAGRDGKLKPYMIVNGSTPSEGEFLNVEPTQFTVDVNHPVNPASVQAGDLVVNGTPATSYTILDPDTVRFQYAISPVTAPGAQSMSIAPGAVQASNNPPSPLLRGWSKTFVRTFPPFVVDAISDIDDGNTSQGHFSLREALRLTNSAPGPDTITFNPAVFNAATTINVGSTLTVAGPLTLTGPAAGLTLNGNNGPFRLFDIDVPGSVANDVQLNTLTFMRGNAADGSAIRSVDEDLRLVDVTIRQNSGGSAVHLDRFATLTALRCTFESNNSQNNGGAIRLGGDASATIANCTFSSNTSVSGAGGAIWSTGTTTITDSAFAGNSAADGGAIWLSGSVAITNCIINENSGNNPGYGRGGGAIRVSRGAHLSITESILRSNSTVGTGGAIHVEFDGSLTIVNSTISGNSCGESPAPWAEGGGGGIYFGGRGHLLMIDCTISGNHSAGVGGGLYFGSGFATNNSWEIKNSTISGNSSDTRGGGIGFQCRLDTLHIQSSSITSNSAVLGGGIEISNVDNIGQNVILESSIVSGNSGGEAPDLNSSINVTPANVVTATNCAIGSPLGFVLSAGSSGNLPFGIALNLGPLQNNGGGTQTHALLPGSPCINTGYNPAGLATDQRGPGYLRVVGSAADIGALEVQATAPTVLGTQVNDGAAQRSRVTSLTVTFDTIVTFESTVGQAFTLIRNGGKPVSFKASASNATGVTVVTLNVFTGASTQFGSLADGRYTLTALASHITDNQGQALDGDANGQPGGNYTFGDGQGLFRMYGDINGDRQVDGADFSAFSFTYGSFASQSNYLWYLDVNGDGQIDGVEFSQFSGRFNTLLP